MVCWEDWFVDTMPRVYEAITRIIIEQDKDSSLNNNPGVHLSMMGYGIQNDEVPIIANKLYLSPELNNLDADEIKAALLKAYVSAGAKEIKNAIGVPSSNRNKYIHAMATGNAIKHLKSFDNNTALIARNQFNQLPVNYHAIICKCIPASRLAQLIEYPAIRPVCENLMRVIFGV